MDSQPLKDIEFVSKSREGFNLWVRETSKWSYIPMDWVTSDGG